jgi:osmotically-inducible protein OsmY
MKKSGALLILATAEPTGEKEALQETAQLLTQGQEDLRLAERVERALRETGYGPLRRIEVAVQARLVLLGGCVPSYYLKQIAQTVALAVPGSYHVRNNLEVI